MCRVIAVHWPGTPPGGTLLVMVPRVSRGLIIGRTGSGRPRLYPPTIFPTVTVLNPEGGPGYKADVWRAVIDGTEGGTDGLSFLSVVKHKTDASSSKCVTVGK